MYKYKIFQENGVGGIKLGSSRIGPDENSDKYKKVLRLRQDFMQKILGTGRQR